jgi:riboflavin kinase/FMN adenylyltransferase
MKVIRGLRSFRDNIEKSAVTVGVFDGVHIGHQKVIKRAVSRARKIGGKSVVVTFDPHPAKVLNPKARVPSLTSLNHRIRLIGRLGADYLVIVRFTKALSRIAPHEFVRKTLIGKLGMRELCVGENFCLGRGGKTGVKELASIAKELCFALRAIKPVRIRGRQVSSSGIRHLIVEGNLAAASRSLSRPVSILGTVVKGSRRGRILGFPTANINPHHEAIPPSGVYAVFVSFGKKVYDAVLNIGVRPTFGQEIDPTIEVHIFDFWGTIYGKDLEISFARKLRDERRFSNRHELASQIVRDAESARAWLRKSNIK